MGRIDITISPVKRIERLWPGMLISCFLRPTNSKVHMAHGTEILIAPMDEASKEIVWVHNLLEISYYFTSPENPAPDVFAVLFKALQFLSLKEELEVGFDVAKKMFFMKLFKCFGFYPDRVFTTTFSGFEEMVFGSVDFKDKRAVESLKIRLQMIKSEELSLIDMWIKRCMARHPNVGIFKSTTFLNN